jgi:AcrR family transcriptional regulator
VTRSLRQQADEQILDRAAALFARQGFAKTSVQDIADAVGLSKAGLLHHFPSKDALQAAVLEQSDRLGQQVVDQVQHLPVGPERDRRAVEAMVDFALGHAGMVALLLAPVSPGGDEVTSATPVGAGAAALLAFGIDTSADSPAGGDTERLVRVVGALAALAVLTLAANQHSQSTAWRPFVVATCYDALGHRRPSASPTDPHQVED